MRYTGIPSSQATDAEVSAAIAAIINGASSASDTFNEVETLLSGKAPIASPSFTTQIISPVAFGSGASGGNLALRSTSHATKGKIIFGVLGTSVYDEVIDRWGFGSASPTERFQLGATTDAISNCLRIVTGNASTDVFPLITFFRSGSIETVVAQNGLLFQFAVNPASRSSVDISTAAKFTITSSGNAGFNSIAPLGRLESRATSGAQGVFSYDATHYAALTVNAAGKLIISSVGTPEIILGTAITDKLGFYGLATGIAQPAHADQAAVPTTTPALASYGFTLAQATALIALVNRLRFDLAPTGFNLIKGSA